jgi:hypothetical protein
MAAHIKQQIRDAAVTALTGLTTTTTKVFAAREFPLQAANLPGICIYTDNEEQEPGTLQRSGRRIIRNLELMVLAYVADTGDIDATLDTIAKEVETALAADVTLGGLAKDLLPVSQVKERDAEGETKAVSVAMLFNVEYHTAQAAPDVALA